MKHSLVAILLLVPGLAMAYPNPNVTLATSAGALVDTMWSQPVTAPLTMADASSILQTGK